MDNLFGKDDSGNDSDAIDIESKLRKRNDCNIEEDTIDIDEHDVKVGYNCIIDSLMFNFIRFQLICFILFICRVM